MRVITKKRLINFWERPGCGDAKEPLKAWYAVVNSKSTAWLNWGHVKAVYRNADRVGNCTVFNIAGNKYRLIARVLYPSQKVFILKVMTHKEYDEGKWKQTCGCFSPLPQRGVTKVLKRKR